jgi:hypothetical protein
MAPALHWYSAANDALRGWRREAGCLGDRLPVRVMGATNRLDEWRGVLWGAPRAEIGIDFGAGRSRSWFTPLIDLVRCVKRQDFLGEGFFELGVRS